MSLKSRNCCVSCTEEEISSNNTGDKIFIVSHLDYQILDDGSRDGNTRMTTTIDPKDLAGGTFLKETEEDVQHF
jgi:hypothetical protein